MPDPKDDNLDSRDDSRDESPPPTIVSGDGRELSALRAAVAASRGRRINRVSWRRRVRAWFHADRLREFGTTLALVAPLTMLIWVWAEREEIETRRRTFYVTVRATDPAKAVSIDTSSVPRAALAAVAGLDQFDNRVPVDVSLTGPRSSLDSLFDRLKDPANAYLTLEIEDAPDVGRAYEVALQPLMDQEKLITDLGISVEETLPDRLRVEVDRMEHRDVPIKLPDELSSIMQLVRVDPAAVKVHGPEREIARFNSEGALLAELQLTRDNPALAELRPNGQLTIQNVKLRPIVAPGLQIDAPSTVNVTVQGVAEQTEAVLDVVPINVSKPSTITTNVRVTPPTLTNVRVIGRADAIRRLKEPRPNDPRPYAELVVTVDDIGKVGRRTLRSDAFRNLPAGVRVVESSVGEVTFDMTDGAATTP